MTALESKQSSQYTHATLCRGRIRTQANLLAPFVKGEGALIAYDPCVGLYS